MPLILAAGTEVATLPAWVGTALLVAPLLLSLLVAAPLNGYIRAQKAKEAPVPSWLLGVALVVNILSGNPDKSIEQGKAIAAKKDEVVP